jgi:hypothetical protein
MLLNSRFSRASYRIAANYAMLGIIAATSGPVERLLLRNQDISILRQYLFAA